MRKTIPVVFLLFLLSSFLNLGKAATIQFDFYSEKIQIEYPVEILKKGDVKLGYANIQTGKLLIQEYYEMLSHQGNHTVLLNDLERIRTEYGLTDWLFYQLTVKAVKKIAKDKSKLHEVLLRWFVLNKAGFDCRLTYWKNRTYINIYTQDRLFEMPVIEDSGKFFVNLSEKEYSGNAYGNLYLADFVANPNGRPFQFSMEKLPSLTSKPITKNIDFKVEENAYQIKVVYDETPIKIMQNYPYMSEEKYFGVPLSGLAMQSLLPQMKQIIQNKTEKESLSILASFTRSAFTYKQDEEHFGKSRPMTPEELFYYPFSDCEDRCALFYVLVKELLNLPIIVLEFDDHVSVAVSTSKEIKGDIIRFDNKNYYVCDPTGPSNSSKIGFFPKGYKEREFKVMLQYK